MTRMCRYEQLVELRDTLKKVSDTFFDGGVDETFSEIDRLRFLGTMPEPYAPQIEELLGHLRAASKLMRAMHDQVRDELNNTVRLAGKEDNP